MKLKGHHVVLLLIMVGMLAGGACGWAFGERMLAVKFLGDIFLNALKMMIVPLIVASMISGVASLGDVRRLGRTGLVTIGYYVVTTGVAVAIGMCLANAIRPGAGVTPVAQELPSMVGERVYTVVDVIVNMIPENVFAAAAETNVLPLIVVSLVFGGILTTLGEKGRPVIKFFEGVNAAVLKLVYLVMMFAPVGVFALVATKLGAAGGGEAFWSELYKLGKYAVTVLTGLALHAFVVLPLLLFLLGRRNPFTYAFNLLTAFATAFSTASSAATLPVTMRAVEKRNRVSNEAASFVLPLGATINMDGTALYEAVAALFIAQVYGIELTAAQQLVIFFTATLAAVGAAAIPEAGLVTMVMVLTSVGLPVEGIGAILAIDWFLDRCRTTVNVWGDSVGAASVDRLEISRRATRDEVEEY
ncbi:MAG: cation:dicarboxylase symporter family transporter [candidate division Zixibacteria bacterium]|nr:cation:dicarboxylase symporter family transporter [candidate division Zixibacteria bacterium]